MHRYRRHAAHFGATLPSHLRLAPWTYAEGRALIRAAEERMKILLDIHAWVAYLLALCALVFSWNPVGRRVMNAVASLQLLAGIALAGTIGANHLPLPSGIWVHILVGLLILGAYGYASGVGKRAGGATRAMAFSVIGLLLIALNIYLGMRMQSGGPV